MYIVEYSVMFFYLKPAVVDLERWQIYCRGWFAQVARLHLANVRTAAQRWLNDGDGERWAETSAHDVAGRHGIRGGVFRSNG